MFENKRLYKRQEGKWFTGVAGGTADFFGIDIDAIRWVWVILSIISFSVVFWLYVILSIILQNGTDKEEQQADEIRRLKHKIQTEGNDRSAEINELKKKAGEKEKRNKK